MVEKWERTEAWRIPTCSAECTPTPPAVDCLLLAQSGNQGVVAYVMNTPYALGYSELGVALANDRRRGRPRFQG